MSAKGLSDMAACDNCGCELGHTVKTPIDSSLAFTALLELHPTYGQMSDPEATELRNRFLADWHKSGHTDMFGYAREWCAANAYGSPYAPNTPEHRVWEQAQEHGRAAASWVFDGNTDKATYQRFLKGIDDGDPEVLDSIHSPVGDLSGDGDYTVDDLMADAGWVPHDGTDLRDALAEQYACEVPQAFWDEVGRQAVEQLKEDPDDLNDRMDFDHVIRVDNRGIVTEPGGYAPELVMFVDEDGQALPDSDEQLREQAKSAGWRLLEGWTGQYRYHGPVMHPSEYVGGRLAEHILETPGEYVVTEVTALAEDEEADSDEPAGWAICFRETNDN